MSAMRTLVRNAAIALIALIATEPAHGSRPALVARSSYTLRITFEGGYLFDFGQTDRIEVVDVARKVYPMNVYDSAGKLLSAVGSRQTLTLNPEGQAPAKVKPGMPDDQQSRDGCDYADDVKHLNSPRFIPNLSEIAGRMGTSIAAPAASPRIQLTGGGAVKVERLGGCVEYRDPSVAPKSWVQRSMASGMDGIVYEWTAIPGSELHLVLVARQPIKVRPDAAGVINLSVGSGIVTGMRPGSPYELTHFWKHLGPAFKSIDTGKKIKLFWTKSYQSVRKSPGIDCPPGATGF